MKSFFTPLLLLLLAPVALQAQYCSPNFAFGCSNWRTLSATVGSINFAAGSDCTVSDHTSLSTSANAGDTLPMTVINGVWCGASVWVDFDQDMSFSDEENLFHQYTGGAPSYTYSFDLIIPDTIVPGSYRMRLISPWGSDGFTPGSMNGFGPCGSFQYGNFQDFTLNVDMSTSVDVNSLKTAPIRLFPNPSSGLVSLQFDRGSVPIERVAIFGMDGQMVLQMRPGATGSMMELDLTGVASGVYMVRCSAREVEHNILLVIDQYHH